MTQGPSSRLPQNCAKNKTRGVTAPPAHPAPQTQARMTMRYWQRMTLLQLHDSGTLTLRCIGTERALSFISSLLVEQIHLAVEYGSAKILNVLTAHLSWISDAVRGVQLPSPLRLWAKWLLDSRSFAWKLKKKGRVPEFSTREDECPVSKTLDCQDVK